MKGIFKKSFLLVIARGVRKGDFAWTFVTPPGLLLNTWSMEGSSDTIDGGCFIPPDSRNSKQHSSIEQKRIALCVAAHICPFWDAIMRAYFKENPLNKVALAKRFRRGDDAFNNAGAKGGRKNKKQRLSKNAAVKGVSKGSGDDRTPPHSDEDAKAPEVDGELPVAACCLSELSNATTLLPIKGLLLLDDSPLLPSSSAVSVVMVSAAKLEAVHEGDRKLAVVLPHHLIKRAYHLLGTTGEAITVLALDGPPSPTALSPLSSHGAEAAASTVVRITVGNHPPVECSTVALAYMSSVVALNKQLQLCASFYEWVQALRSSTSRFPMDLEFFVDCGLTVVAAADDGWSSCADSRVGDPAKRFFLLGAGSRGDAAGSDLYGVSTVAFSDIVLGGQRAYMTSALLDAALVEMWMHVALRVMPGYVLLTSQSAAFMTCNNKRVPEDVALQKIKEVYEVMPRARYQRFVMLLNLSEHHWISAEVQPARTITIFDSSDGAFKEEEDFAVRRVELFAHELDRLRRLGDPTAPPVDKWAVNFINAPVQEDGYNCGPLTLAHIWCAANGLELGRIPAVAGDHLRLGFLFTLLHCGKRYDEARRPALASGRDKRGQ